MKNFLEAETTYLKWTWDEKKNAIGSIFLEY